MAVIQTRAGRATQDDESGKLKPVRDIMASDLPSGRKSKLDPTQDAWESIPPPDEGDYPLNLFLSDTGFQMGRYDEEDDNPTNSFYMANLECRIAGDDPQTKGAVVYNSVGTRIYRGRDISTMAGLIVKMGFKVPTEATDHQIAKLFAQALKREPTLWALVDWRGWSKTLERQVYNTMSDFPIDPATKKRKHIVSISIPGAGTEEITARAFVKHWYGVGKPTKSKAHVSSLQPATTTVPTPVPPRVAPAPSAVASAPSAVALDDSELVLDLE